ncbi:DNA-binding MarR family transcriptional regulator [Microbacterium endophyticum]|uniref:DNA-binding MarR family transcriptional regulator n=1 Tax=Microbacterium endophyticum TaxID=1526412 RepID=A0A7W4V197_9MICO|nr:MarR family transcriptional regulator [Microbacterium endophyticum]MBB2974704.1 DNA-binding MarR family transcriptional regulator [Microbacterium endophyticum]NIK37001.1 DNA-binding MarR family transcriptional regulator [Microbacterium endophyticum]
MSQSDDLERLVVGGHALARIAARKTGNDAPAAQWRAISLLRSDGPRRVGELAAMCRTTQPGMTRLLGHLEDLGFVERAADPADSRATIVRALPAGEAALQRWQEQMRDALQPIFSDLSEADWAAVNRVATILDEHTRVEAGSIIR